MKIKRIVGFTHKNTQTSGHEVHKKTIAYDDQYKTHHVIFKVNKFQSALGQEISKLEACFSALANLLGKPTLALKQDIVTNDEQQIVGIATEHASHMLLRMHDNFRFAQCNTLSSTPILSEVEFSNWLKQIKPINNVSSKWENLKNHSEMDDSLNQSVEESIQPVQEQEPFCTNSAPLDNLLLDKLVSFSHTQVKSEPESTVNDLSLKFQSNKELTQQLIQNTQTAQKIARMDVGTGFNFLDSLPQNFFAHLMKAKEANEVDVDMDSLVDIFTTAYCLEEDDLHKGNIGYYITVGKKNKLCFHFFKIDHDLMFINKLMSSRNGARFNQLHYTNQNFAISARDLTGFPDLQESGNHYWPTKTSLFVKGAKAYHSSEERNAFKKLKNDPEFVKRKWLRFLKQTIISSELIQAILQKPLSALENEGEIKATTSLIERAFSSRMAELQQILLSIPEFCQYIKENEEVMTTEIMEELEQYQCNNNVLNASKQKLKQLLNFSKEIQDPCTPLQAALLTQTYRCYETAHRFSIHMQTKNHAGQTPFEYALEQYNTVLKKQENPNLISYYADVVCDLYKMQPHECQIQYANNIKEMEIHCSYHSLPCVTTLEEFKKVIETLREQPGCSLKQDKVYALKLLEKSKLDDVDLHLLKKELAHPDHASPLKFIKELRSELWIIKRIWGAYGNTSTYKEMNHLIQRKIDKSLPIQHNSILSFF